MDIGRDKQMGKPFTRRCAASSLVRLPGRAWRPLHPTCGDQHAQHAERCTATNVAANAVPPHSQRPHKYASSPCRRTRHSLRSASSAAVRLAGCILGPLTSGSFELQTWDFQPEVCPAPGKPHIGDLCSDLHVLATHCYLPKILLSQRLRARWLHAWQADAAQPRDTFYPNLIA
jgi:hypothetical protein